MMFYHKQWDRGFLAPPKSGRFPAMLKNARPACGFFSAIALAVGLAALSVAGCAPGTDLTPTTSSTPGDIAANFQALADIPIPAGAKLDSQRSLILGNLDRWTGRIVMRLDFPIAQAVGLFQQQMPSFGWQPVMAMQGERSILTYLRGDRAATIEIQSGSLYGSLVQVTVAPRQADLPPPPPTPTPAGETASPR